MSILAPFQVPNLAQPTEGSLGIAITFDMTTGAAVAADITPNLLQDKFAFAQSVYIDNADNSARFDLTFFGGPNPYRVSCPPFQQGWFPVSAPVGNGRMLAQSAGAVKVNVLLSNFPMPYLTWGPQDGTLVAPALTNKALNALNFAAPGNQQLVAGVGGQSVKLYRGIFSVDQPTILTWTDGPGGTVLFAAQLTAGGSVTFQVSGAPWFNAGIGDDLTLHSSAACNVYGGFGYVQS